MASLSGPGVIGAVVLLATAGVLTTCSTDNKTPGNAAPGGGGAGSGAAGTMQGASGASAGSNGVGGSAGSAGGSITNEAGPPTPSDAGEAGPNKPPPLGAWPPPAFKLTAIADATNPTAIVAAPGDPTRLFFLEKAGLIRVIKDGQLLAQPALDWSAKVLEGDPPPLTGDKRGAVGLVFHPDYAANGRLFVMYALDKKAPGHTVGDLDDGDVVIEEYARGATPDVINPTPTAKLIQIPKGTCASCYQHNGGSLEIGADGFLYAGTGDPPPYDDVGAQNLDSPLGKMLRYDITGAAKPAGNYPGAAPVVWDIGLRNPYKFSFDRVTGYMYIGDVGEDTWEEISIEAPGDGHKNFGWPMREGKHGTPCATCVEPIAEHGHDNADNAIIGGMVYRGKKIPDLQGTYLYGDNGSSRVRALQTQDGKLVNGPIILASPKVGSACFGQDLAGELYVCGYTEHKIFRIDPL